MAKRTFKMHPKLLLDVIKRQAGTIQKAVLEGVMNSIEAGASRVEVGVDVRRVTIRDDGRGFRSAREVGDWFETFGQPHDESEGKKWAQFRMGRGQMFAFGRNVWRTGEFRMLVDVESWARNPTESDLGYDLETGNPLAAGCAIEIDLYEPLSDREISGINREIETYVKYVGVPVLVNGVQVSKDPALEKWGPESSNLAHVRLTDSSRGLDVYNMGVFVRRYPQWEFGVSGVVVSRQKLDVNFARNDVVRSCKAWKAIKAAIDQSDRAAKVKRKSNLTDDERLSLIDKLGAGELTEKEARNLKLLVDATGHAWSPRAVANAGFMTWTLAPAGDRRADRLLQRKTCLALDEENVAEFKCKPEELFETRWKDARFGGPGFALLGWRYHQQLRFVPFETAAKGIEGKSVVLHESEWTERERAWIEIAEDLQHLIYRYAAGSGPSPRRAHGTARKLTIGASDVAEAWTDGANYIALARETLKGLAFEQHDRPAQRGIAKVACVLMHEICHEEDSEGAPHSPEFYKAYHDLCMEALPNVMNHVTNFLTPQKLSDVKRRARDRQGKATRKAAALRRQREKVPQKKAERRPKKAEPTKVAASASAPTAGMLDEDVLRLVHEARKNGEPWGRIEARLGLRPANGMTAVHANERFKRFKRER